MEPCDVCGNNHHLHTENDLSNCLVWANDENRKLKAEIKRLNAALAVYEDEPYLCNADNEKVCRECDGGCIWIWTDDGMWETECNEAFSFTTGDPKENDMKYCPYCGKKIVQVEGDNAE